MSDCLIAEVTRGSMTESLHRVHAMICDNDGVAQVWGDPDLMFYPRSSIKFLQALPLVESGAADAFQVSPKELALACASHSGTPAHTTSVAAWLDRLGLHADQLSCGAHLPYHDPSAHDLIRSGDKPTKLNNNCSGKHTGFLATALHLNEPIEGYLDPGHPVQRRLYEILVELGGQDLADTGRGIDGCGIPVYGMTLTALATAVQKFGKFTKSDADRGSAVQRIFSAATQHPDMVGGPERFDTDVMRALGGAVATKGGAEGVHIAIVPSKGIGIALKTEDGNKRAADAAMGAILLHLGLIANDKQQLLVHHLQPSITNAANDLAGTINVIGL